MKRKGTILYDMFIILIIIVYVSFLINTAIHLLNMSNIINSYQTITYILIIISLATLSGLFIIVLLLHDIFSYFKNKKKRR